MLLSNLRAQDPQFSQFYAIPLYLSPSFAGTYNGSRFAMNYRNQWTAIPNTYVSYAFSFDHNFVKQFSSVGLFALHDQAGSGALSLTKLGLVYAYTMDFKHKFQIRPGIHINVNRRGLDYHRLIFKDQILNDSPVSMYEEIKPVKYYPDASASVAFFSKKVWMGFTVDHLLMPNQTLEMGDAPVPRKYSFFGGTKIYRGDFLRFRERSLTIAYLYKHQNKYDQVDIGVYANFYPIVLGSWYRGIPFKTYSPKYANNESIVFLVGFRITPLYVGYSYDFTISHLGPSTGGSHELAIIYEFNENKTIKKRRRKTIVACPKF